MSFAPNGIEAKTSNGFERGTANTWGVSTVRAVGVAAESGHNGVAVAPVALLVEFEVNHLTDWSRP